jgi:hypothetical protein
MKSTAITILFFLSATALGGCYYEIQDVRTGRMYYSRDWVAADGYRGPLTFEDHEGRKRRVDDAYVLRLDKRDYESVMRDLDTAQPSPAAPPPN